MDGAYVYLLECRDGSLYCGSTRGEIDTRLSEHQNGLFEDSYTYRRRPVKLLWCEHFANIADAVDCERRLKGWSRAKKLAMIEQNWTEVSRLARNADLRAREPSTSILRQAQDEVEGAARNEASLNDASQTMPPSPFDLTLSLSKGRGRTHGHAR